MNSRMDKSSVEKLRQENFTIDTALAEELKFDVGPYDQSRVTMKSESFRNSESIPKQNLESSS